MNAEGWYLWGAFYTLLVPWTVTIVVMAIRAVTVPIVDDNQGTD